VAVASALGAATANLNLLVAEVCPVLEGRDELAEPEHIGSVLTLQTALGFLPTRSPASAWSQSPQPSWDGGSRSPRSLLDQRLGPS
jgi:hypothetical protein